LIMDAVEELDLRAARVNQRGTGDEQYPPAMMLGLLVYCYASGVFSSRVIEGMTYENVAVRVLCADTHPDHDTICAFRRNNGKLLAEGFAQAGSARPAGGRSGKKRRSPRAGSRGELSRSDGAPGGHQSGAATLQAEATNN
jgi:transposase